LEHPHTDSHINVNIMVGRMMVFALNVMKNQKK
jgi:hypothetical protein